MLCYTISTLYYTILYFTIFTLLCFTLFYFTLLLRCLNTLFYFTLLYFTLLYLTLLYFTLLYFTLLYFTLLYFTLLYFTLLYFTIMWQTYEVDSLADKRFSFNSFWDASIRIFNCYLSLYNKASIEFTISVTIYMANLLKCSTRTLTCLHEDHATASSSCSF